MSKKVLMVCLGNICRSPTAHGVFEKKSQHLNVTVDSCGTAAYHIGKAPDERSQLAAKKRGYDLSKLKARQVEQNDFEDFDLVLAMDKQNYQNLLAICPEHLMYKVKMFLSFADRPNDEVPDPYYGAEDGFNHVLDLCEEASAGLVEALS